MEPYHELRFPDEQWACLLASLADEGIQIERPDGECWFDRRPGFKSLLCLRGDEKSLFALGPDFESKGFSVLVFVNTHQNQLTTDIRKNLESQGAVWGYGSD